MLLEEVGGGGKEAEGLWEERGGGVDFQECVCRSLVFPLMEKMQAHYVTEKESACQISPDSEQLEKMLRNLTSGRLPLSHSIECILASIFKTCEYLSN